MSSSTSEFEAECVARVHQLKAAFIELYVDVGMDPQKPQDVSRSLRVNKTLTWSVSRLIAAPDHIAAVAHIPGETSLEKVITATARRGADPSIVARARQAVADFRRMVQAHTGDRPTLDLIVDSATSTKRRGDKLELARKLAFRGNSGLYGVQARTRLKLAMVAPSPHHPDELDMVDLCGYVDFRRIRPNVRWPLFAVRSWADAAPRLDQPDQWQPIEPPADPADHSRIIHSATRGTAPNVQPIKTAEGLDFMLGHGPVGNEGAFDCFMGEYLRRAVPRYRQRDSDVGEFGAAITAPSEHLVFDLIVHNDLAELLNASVLVFGRIFPTGQHTGGPDDPCLIPIQQTLSPLPGSPTLVATSLVPGYPRLYSTVLNRLGWSPADFTGTRLVMKYPPLGSNVILRFPLPARTTPA
jgi:hypothetical protein